MYEAFYGLKAKPFQLNPDTAFYFDSRQHRRAKAYLEYGLNQGDGFIVVTGEIGAGKTTIVRGLLETLDRDRVVAAHIVSTQVDADDILRLVAAGFGVFFKDLAKADLILSLEAFFTSVALEGKRCLLIVDEAQNITQRAVEELRMLSNFQFDGHSLLQGFLVGQPEFRNTLVSPRLEQLRQRVLAACHIGPLDANETRNYIYHRLRCAGYGGDPKFDEAAHAAIYQASGGIPRRINSVCERLLLAGYLADKKTFGEADVRDVVKEMTEATSPISRGLSDLDATSRDPREGAREQASQEAGKHASAHLPQADRSLNAQERSLEERLLRLERGLVRIEHVNVKMLRALQLLVNTSLGGSAGKKADASSLREPTEGERA